MNIIVTGHGNFSSGMLSALQLIAGKQENVSNVDFLENDSTAQLSDKLKVEIDKSDNEILILSDLLGGSPYKESVLLKASNTSKNIEVISGTNFPILLHAVLSDTENALELAKEIINMAQGTISLYELKKPQIVEEEDGI